MTMERKIVHKFDDSSRFTRIVWPLYSTNTNEQNHDHSLVVKCIPYSSKKTASKLI